jgi:hypothetical protein
MLQSNNAGLVRKPYVTPSLKLYGSVSTLTAGGTGMTSELGSSTGTPMTCYDGMTPGNNQARKHCV